MDSIAKDVLAKARPAPATTAAADAQQPSTVVATADAAADADSRQDDAAPNQVTHHAAVGSTIIFGVGIGVQVVARVKHGPATHVSTW